MDIVLKEMVRLEKEEKLFTYLKEMEYLGPFWEFKGIGIRLYHIFRVKLDFLMNKTDNNYMVCDALLSRTTLKRIRFFAFVNLHWMQKVRDMPRSPTPLFVNHHRCISQQ